MRGAALLVAICAAGCAIETSAGRAQTGEPLSLRTRDETTTLAYQQQVGTVDVRDASGVPVATAGIYENRVATNTRLRWMPLQGAQPIADEDFFRFTGNGEAAESSRSYRRVGWSLAIGGAAVAAVAVAALVAASSMPEGNGARVPLGVGGFFGVLGGPCASFYGFGFLNPENHAVSYGVAQDSLEKSKH